MKRLIYDTRLLCSECDPKHPEKLSWTKLLSPPAITGSEVAQEEYRKNLFTSIYLAQRDGRPNLLDHSNTFIGREFCFPVALLTQIPKLQAVAVTDGSRTYDDAALVSVFQMRMLRDCGLDYLQESDIYASPAYTADRSCGLYMALTHTHRNLRQLICRASGRMQPVKVLRHCWPTILTPEMPFSSLRTIHLPQDEAAPSNVTDDTEGFTRTLTHFLTTEMCNLETLEFKVTGVTYQGLLERTSRWLCIRFPVRGLVRIKSLLLAGMILDQEGQHG